ncbi:MAG: SLC13 family permease [Gaiellaceae bacterium]
MLSHSTSALDQAWPAFALVVGLLLVGAAAAHDGLFRAAGALAARAPGGAVVLLVLLLALEALVTAVLNLDTAVVFLTPVLLHAARRRGIAEEPFLYGAVFMANSASLLLPGSNLTNLIVLAHARGMGPAFAARLAPAWGAAVAVTIGFVVLAFRRQLFGRGGPPGERVPFRPHIGTAGVALAAVLVLTLARPALPVLALGIVVALRTQLSLRAASPLLLGGMLMVTVALGTLARSVGGIAIHTGRWSTALLGAVAAIGLNNLPAAALLSAHAPAHPLALLLGLDLGPNLAITGSLSALLWLRVARAHAAAPSAMRYSVLGLVLVPVSLALSLAIA